MLAGGVARNVGGVLCLDYVQSRKGAASLPRQGAAPAKPLGTRPLTARNRGTGLRKAGACHPGMEPQARSGSPPWDPLLLFCAHVAACDVCRFGGEIRSRTSAIIANWPSKLRLDASRSGRYYVLCQVGDGPGVARPPGTPPSRPSLRSPPDATQVLPDDSNSGRVGTLLMPNELCARRPPRFPRHAHVSCPSARACTR